MRRRDCAPSDLGADDISLTSRMSRSLRGSRWVSSPRAALVWEWWRRASHDGGGRRTRLPLARRSRPPGPPDGRSRRGVTRRPWSPKPAHHYWLSLEALGSRGVRHVAQSLERVPSIVVRSYNLGAPWARQTTALGSRIAGEEVPRIWPSLGETARSPACSRVGAASSARTYARARALVLHADLAGQPVVLGHHHERRLRRGLLGRELDLRGDRARVLVAALHVLVE